MKFTRLCLAAALLTTTAPATAGKPGSTTFEPELAYTLLTGSNELHLTDATGAKSATVYSVRQTIRIDLAPRAQHQIAISELNTLKLLTYSVDASGVKTVSVVPIYNGGSEQITFVDFSPDGSKIAFSQNFRKLMVIDLTNLSAPPILWATDPDYVGRLTWYKGGSAIAYIGSGSSDVFEVTAPGAPPTHLLHDTQIDQIDASRTDPDALVVTYNRVGPQGPRAALWKNGSYVTDNLAGNVFTDFASLNCDDSKLIYGTPDSKGQLIWYIRTLPNGPSTLYTKTLRVHDAQFMPTCAAAAAQTNGAFDFRVPPGN